MTSVSGPDGVAAPLDGVHAGMRVVVGGAGVGGLTVAFELARRGVSVTVAERRGSLKGCASWYAGGMLAPWCERESAEEQVVELGEASADWWEEALPGHVTREGTLVVAPTRDRGEIDRFAARTSNYEYVDADAIARLEPALAGRFRVGLHFAGEAHLNPRRALEGLHERLLAMGVTFHFNTDVHTLSGFDRVIDCTGNEADLTGLRGVRGEMMILHAPDVEFSRPVRVLHPRIPLYVVPRSGNLFMIGATMIESDDDGPVRVRSAMELLNAVYGLHPAFADAAIVEMGYGLRPAFDDNLPRVEASGDTVTVNGFYRHGFLLAPAMAKRAADVVLHNVLHNQQPGISAHASDRQREPA